MIDYIMEVSCGTFEKDNRTLLKDYKELQSAIIMQNANSLCGEKNKSLFCFSMGIVCISLSDRNFQL